MSRFSEKPSGAAEGKVTERYEEQKPSMQGAYVHPSAVVMGAVALAESVSVWPNATLRGDYNPIRVGRGSNIQDGSVLHSDTGKPCLIGEDVIVGHLALVHGATVGDRCLIGMHSTILNGAIIGEESIIGAGALVGEGKVIPPRSLVLGVPGKVVRQVTDAEVQRILDSAASYRGYAQRQLPQMGG
jgi:carbonic anhydrase/acetyltransferase-like protein (isoleucine patch superfamily)